MRLMTFAFFFGIITFHTQTVTLNVSIQFYWILWVIVIYLFLLIYTYKLPLLLKFSIAYLLGFLWIAIHASIILAQALPEKLEGKNIILSGKIVSVPKQTNCHYDQAELPNWQFDFLPDKTNDYPNIGKIRLTWCDSFLHTLQPEGQWQFDVKLKNIHPLTNFDLLDYSKLLFQQQIRVTGKVRNAISYTPHLSSLTHIRYQLARKITQYSSDNSQITALLIALTLGIKHWHPDMKENHRIFKQTGTTHLFVISGLHLSAVALTIFWFSHFIWRYINSLKLPAIYFASTMSLMAIIYYSLLAGFEVQTQRALIMVSAFMLGLLLNKQINTSHKFTLALLFVLLYDPLVVISSGFWLSFMSVAAILYVAEIKQRSIEIDSQKMQFLPKKIAVYFLNFYYSQLIIIFILSPVVLYVFGQAPLNILISNFIAIPMISIIILPLALLSLLAVIISPAFLSFIPKLLLFITVQLLDFTVSILEILSKNAIFLQQFSPSIWAVIAAMVGGIILFLPKGFPARWLGFFWILPLFFPTSQLRHQGDMTLTLLDVGQGLSAVIETQNHTLIYDVGSFFAGKQIVMPYLHTQGISYIDKLIISHDDNDHAGGLEAMRENIKINQILSSQPNGDMDKCRANKHWQWDKVHFEFLHPVENYQNRNDNNMSCVLKISNGKYSILLTGDIHQEVEILLSQHKKIASDILIVPHHGSRSSSNPIFIQAVSPQLALFSSGYHNQYHHPHPQVEQNYRRLGIPTLNTAKVGAIQIHLTTTGIQPPRLAWEVEQHYWRD